MPLIPNVPQQDILNSDKRVTILLGGTGVGTSTACVLFLLKHIALNPSARFLALSPTYKAQEYGILPIFLKEIYDTPYRGRWNKSKNEYYLRDDGGRVYFRSAGSLASVEGLYVNGGGCMDEGGVMSCDVFDQMYRRTRFCDAPLFIGSNPYSCKWLEELVVAPDDPELYVRQACSLENPHFPREMWENGKRELSASQFAESFMCQFNHEPAKDGEDQ